MCIKPGKNLKSYKCINVFRMKKVTKRVTSFYHRGNAIAQGMYKAQRCTSIATWGATFVTTMQ